MDIAVLGRREVVSIDERATVLQAAALMRDCHVGALVILTEEHDVTRLAGVVTDRDLTLHVLAAGLDVNTPVGSIARGKVISVPLSASVADAVATMRDAGVRRLVLVDHDHRLAGILSLDDLLRAFAAEMGDLAGALRSGIEHEAVHHIAEGSPHRPVLVPEELASAWRHVVAP